MFADPQVVTYATVGKNLPAIARGDTQSEYRLYDTGGVVFDLILAHQFKARNRAIARLRRDVYAADPLVPAQNILASMTATLTVDFPLFGVTAADASNLVNALHDWGTSALLLRLISGET